MKSQHSFQQVEGIRAPRSQFNLSFPNKTTFDAGWLIPILDLAVIPGDTINLKLDFFNRLATPLHPIMDNAWTDTQFFFVPDRQVMGNFRKMMGEQDNPGDSIDYVYPILDSTAAITADPEGDLSTPAGRTARLLDYIGVPTGIGAADVDITSMTLRAINHCYNHWYRDQNFIDSIPSNTDDGPDASSDYELQRRGKRHDYFTSCLPYPQKDDTAVLLPIGGSAPVKGIGTPAAHVSGSADGNTYNVTDGTQIFTYSEDFNIANGLKLNFDAAGAGSSPSIYADLTDATSSTVNDIREAIQIQRLLERDARMGTRFPEVMSSQYGVTNFYDLTYRPQYLGGGSSPLNVSPIAATNSSIANSLGDMGGIGTSNSSNTHHGFSQSFTEPGRIIGFMSVRASYTYQQGLNRFLSKRTRYDIALPVLSHLGEQEILNKEIYCDGSANDDLVFGFNERYAEYRYMPARLSGLFRSAATASLDPWHLAQEFSSLPNLGQTFIEEDGGTTSVWDRVCAITNEPHFISDMYFNITAARPLPVFGTPGMMDHF